MQLAVVRTNVRCINVTGSNLNQCLIGSQKRYRNWNQAEEIIWLILKLKSGWRNNMIIIIYHCWKFSQLLPHVRLQDLIYYRDVAVCWNIHIRIHIVKMHNLPVNKIITIGQWYMWQYNILHWRLNTMKVYCPLKIEVMYLYSTKSLPW